MPQPAPTPVIHKPCESFPFMMSYCRRSSLSISNDSASRGARVTGIADADVDGAAGTQLFIDDRKGGVRECRDGLDPVENRVDRGRVFLHRAEDRWHDSQDVDAVRGGNRDERRSVGTAADKRERGVVDAPGFHNYASRRRTRPTS